MRQRESLIARVRQMRRAEAASDPPPAPDQRRTAPPTIESLEARLAHLEGLVEGLQDSVHRVSLRQGRQIADLESRLDPAALAVALSRDARDRGL